MSEPIDLPVIYDGKELSFPMELIPMGFSYKIRVVVQAMEVLFEPDEEKNYRATVSMEDQQTATRLDKHLLQAISEALHELLH